MKRSKVNQAITEAIAFFLKANISLPPFAYWSIKDWRKHKYDAKEIIDTRLGWDVTDFGSGKFYNMGRTIFTLRNGLTGSKKYKKPYSQKIMYLREGQKSPVHYHKNKMEDIINHFGGNIAIMLWHKTKSGGLSDRKVSVSIDGIKNTVRPGKELLLKPGQSICIKPGMYHQFWAEKGKGPVVSFEVSSVNDDLSDNIWLKDNKRFPEIDEDGKQKFLLCSEYNSLFT